MIAVMGTVRLAPGEIDRLASAFATMMAATRAEDGCIQYVYSRDLTDPNHLVVSELWRDETALMAHFQTPHMAELNKTIAGAKVLSLSVKRHDIATSAQLMGAD